MPDVSTYCLCTSCVTGCTGCHAGCTDCTGDCEGSCSGCSGSCSGCSGSCQGGCFGTCSGNCSGCSGSCQGTCKSSCSASCTSTCSGTCTSCTGTCSGGCKANCQGQCDNACTADSEAEIIAHLGDNIAIGRIIMAMDYTELKGAMDNEYRRRGKELPSDFETQPIPGEPVSLAIAQKVLTDVYEFDKLPEHDWRENFQLWDMASASFWKKVIDYIKTLMTSIATS